MQQFKDNDAGYLAWVSANPTGYVVNVDKAMTRAEYPMVHHASHGLVTNGQNYTSGDYFKVCSQSLEELQEWSQANSGRGLSWCQACAVKQPVGGTPPAGGVADSGWSDAELQASVVAYLEMRQKLRTRQPCVKKHYYEGLSAQFGRTSKAFEFRMQNISHVLELMGRPWIPGLLPARNVGAAVAARIEALIAEVEGKQVAPVAAFAIQVREAAKKLKAPAPGNAKPTGNPKPTGASVTVTQYLRDPAVKAWVLREAKGICECCLQPAPFSTADGPFLEVHHVRLLAEQGSDTVCNAIAICPNCHRRLHYGLDAAKLIKQLYAKIGRLSPTNS